MKKKKKIVKLYFHQCMLTHITKVLCKNKIYIVFRLFRLRTTKFRDLVLVKIYFEAVVIFSDISLYF